MYIICKGTITVLHFNIRTSSKYNLSIMLLGNDVTKALYPSHCEILCFYSKPFSDNLCNRDKKLNLNDSYTLLFQSTLTCFITLLISHLHAALQLPKCSLISLDT